MSGSTTDEVVALDLDQLGGRAGRGRGVDVGPRLADRDDVVVGAVDAPHRYVERAPAGSGRRRRRPDPAGGRGTLRPPRRPDHAVVRRPQVEHAGLRDDVGEPAARGGPGHEVATGGVAEPDDQVSASTRGRVDGGPDVGQGVVGRPGAAAVLDHPGRPAGLDQARHHRLRVLQAVLRLPEAAVHDDHDAARVTRRSGQLTELVGQVAVPDELRVLAHGASSSSSSPGPQATAAAPSAASVSTLRRRIAVASPEHGRQRHGPGLAQRRRRGPRTRPRRRGRPHRWYRARASGTPCSRARSASRSASSGRTVTRARAADSENSATNGVALDASPWRRPRRAASTRPAPGRARRRRGRGRW